MKSDKNGKNREGKVKTRGRTGGRRLEKGENKLGKEERERKEATEKKQDWEEVRKYWEEKRLGKDWEKSENIKRRDWEMTRIRTEETNKRTGRRSKEAEETGEEI